MGSFLTVLTPTPAPVVGTLPQGFAYARQLLCLDTTPTVQALPYYKSMMSPSVLVVVVVVVIVIIIIIICQLT